MNIWHTKGFDAGCSVEAKVRACTEVIPVIVSMRRALSGWSEDRAKHLMMIGTPWSRLLTLPSARSSSKRLAMSKAILVSCARPGSHACKLTDPSV